MAKGMIRSSKNIIRNQGTRIGFQFYSAHAACRRSTMLKNPDFCVTDRFLQITNPEEIRLHIHEANSRIDMGMALKCVQIMVAGKYLSKMVVLRSIKTNSRYAFFVTQACRKTMICKLTVWMTVSHPNQNFKHN